MNLIDHYVTELIGKPYKKYNKWWQVVRADSMGVIGVNQLMFNTKEEALKVKVGYHFLA